MSFLGYDVDSSVPVISEGQPSAKDIPSKLLDEAAEANTPDPTKCRPVYGVSRDDQARRTTVPGENLQSASCEC